MNWYRAGLLMMALKGRLTSVTSKTTLSVQLFSGVPNIIGREMLPRGVMEPGSTPGNGCKGVSLDMGICIFWKATRLVRLRGAPPSIRMWYSLTLAMVGRQLAGAFQHPPCSWGSQRHQSRWMSPSTFSEVSLLALAQLLPPPGAVS
jgi:hypothetical protein